MGIIKKMRRQKAVYWAKTEANEFGDFSFAAPVEIDCRWEGIAQEFADEKGETRISNSVVYVDRVMHIGDKLKRGSMDSNISDDPDDETDVGEIQQFHELPDLKTKETLLTAYL